MQIFAQGTGFARWGLKKFAQGRTLTCTEVPTCLGITWNLVSCVLMCWVSVARCAIPNLH